MARKRGCRMAILAAVLAFSLIGCSRELPTSSSRVASRTVHGGPALVSSYELEAPARGVTFIVPEASGTILKMPEFGVFARISDDLASTYFRTTSVNRQFRRGFAEFTIPNFIDVFSARILLKRDDSWRAAPVPPDRHELSYYTDVDLIVNTDDYDRSSTPLGTFETDDNENHQSFEFDVSKLFVQSQGARLGFRLKLEVDPTETGFRPLGAGFGRSTNPCGFRIAVTTTSVEAGDLLQAQVQGMGLAANVEAALLAPLAEIGDILRDDDPGNDNGACVRLRQFLDEVAARSQNRQLDPTQAYDLLESGRNLMTCRQGDSQLAIYRDRESFEAAAPRLVEVDFEPGHGRAGLTFRDPWGVESGLCSPPDCEGDPDNPDGNDVWLAVNPGATIEFPGGTTAAMLVVMGDNPFQVKVTDSADNAAIVDGAGVASGVAYLGFVSPRGIIRIDLLGVGGGGGPLVLSAVYFGRAQKGTQSRIPTSAPRP